MANFTLTNSIDFSKIDKAAGQEEILIGFPNGLTHSGTGESIASIAEKLTYGAGPQVWKSSRQRQIGLTKSGKPRMSKKAIEKTHSVKGIPARPFLEEGIADGQAGISKRIEAHFKQRLEGNTTNTTLIAVAVACVGAVQKFVRGDYYKSAAPNSPTTQDAKGSDKPLIDTGQMLNSLTFVIKDQVYSKKKTDAGKKEWST
jgi:hypothetical protein